MKYNRLPSLKSLNDYSYNLANLLTEVNNSNGSTQISKYSYTYYVDGNQKSKAESVAGTDKGTTNYTYDGLNRLVKEQISNTTYSYQYDSYGNRSQLSVTGDESYTTNYSYDKNNRLRNQTKTSGNVSEITDYWYDPNGNQISSMTVTTGTDEDAGVGIEPAGGNTNSINEYDSWNQLTKTMQNGKTASYTYNGDGLRMTKTVDSITTNHIWDGTNIAADVTNGTVTKYIRGIQLISSKTGSNESFYTYNAHGDVVQLTNGSGDITKQYSYDAFGVEQNKDDSDTNPFRYCGEYFDNETESIYLRARYYDPGSGRFITEDPIRDGLNWYSYAANNPIKFVDPWGLAAGDDFNSISDALFDAYVCLYGITDFAQIELGFALYSYEVVDNEGGEKKVVYSYTNPILGFPDGVKLAGLELRIPEGTAFNGYVHTHPGCENYMQDYSETFSGMDKDFIDEKPEGTALYLLTQQGTIRVLTSTGETHIASTSKQRYEGTVICKDLSFKELHPMQKLSVSLRYGKAISEHISGGGCDFHDNDYLNRIEVDDIYNNIQKYTEFLAGKR